MVRLTWDKTAQKVFYIGVDRGVFYPESRSPGQVWNGLVAVNTTKDRGMPRSVYQNGELFTDIDASDTKASVDAFTYPDEIEAYLGLSEISDGVYIDDQPAKIFHLAYRTLIGNDVEGTGYAYEIHILYNVMALPMSNTNTSISASPTPDTFHWDLILSPVYIAGKYSSAHFILRSDQMDAGKLRGVEEVLYGSSKTTARLPYPDELLEIIKSIRFVFPARNVTLDNIPNGAVSGDIIYDRDTNKIYGYRDISPDIRDVIVLEDPEMFKLSDQAYPRDLVYDPNTGILYRIEET